MTVHMDWYRNNRDDHVLAVEDNASHYVFDPVETDSSSAAVSFELLNSVCEQWRWPVPILEVIIDHGSEFVNTRQDERPCENCVFEGYHHDNDINGHSRDGRTTTVGRQDQAVLPDVRYASLAARIAGGGP